MRPGSSAGETTLPPTFAAILTLAREGVMRELKRAIEKPRPLPGGFGETWSRRTRRLPATPPSSPFTISGASRMVPPEELTSE